MKPILPLQLLVQPDRQDPQPLVIYHGRSCPDGFAAALAAKLFYGDSADYLGLDHGDVKSLADLPPVAGRAVYVLDFSFAEDILRGIEAQAAKLVLLDHHQSAAEKLTGFACRCGVVHFDMAKSGARLAWEFFAPHTPIPDLVRFVEDRDLWTWQYADSAAYLAALDMEPFDFDRWAQIAAFDADTQAEFMARGHAMDDKFTKLATDIVQGAQPVVFNGVAGLMVNAPGVFHSLVGEMLSQKSGTYALMWTAAAKDHGGVVKVGLRSQRGFDCIPLASSMGGGGHAQACGFKMAMARLPELLAGSLTVNPTTPVAKPPRTYLYYDFVMAAFVCVLLCSNFIGAAKQAVIDLPFLGSVPFSAGVLFFPISYIFGDILTEVYGYGRDRRVVWAGFGAIAFASFMAWVVVSLPPGPSDYMKSYQPALESVFGNAWRIAAGSMIAFWCGSFANSFVLAKMKIAAQGKSLWKRTIGSTIVGEAVDSSLFYFIAFYGIWQTEDLIKTIVAQYLLKTGWEVLMTPVTYKVVAFLKRKENEDYYDRGTDFNPFKLST